VRGLEGIGPGRLVGVGAVIVAWLAFAMHDATVKLLVADASAWQVLFARSVLVLPFCLALRRRARPNVRVAWPVRRVLLLNAVVYALAWIAYYSAARDLQLAELETVYFASPILATALAVALLGERVPQSRWLALGVGFAGVLLACGPASFASATAVGLALVAAALWALSVVLMRQLSASVSTATQMLVNNSVFLGLCAVAAPWWWRAPSGLELAFMGLVALTGLIAQYLLYEGLRRVPASLAAPLEYTGLLWSFALGYLIWGDVPAQAVFLGAGLIVLSGALVVLGEWQPRRQAAPMALDGAEIARAEPSATG
jgi:drug/metabolite transporter (DMT)-like permease